VGNGSTWKTFVVAGAAAAALVGAALLSPEGCGQKPAGPEAGGLAASNPASPAGPGAAAPSAADMEKWLTEEKLPFRALEAGKRWAITFEGQNTGTLTVIVVRGKDVTTALVRLFQVPDGASAAFYQALLRQNFAMFQIKLGLSDRNDLFLSYEVPNRILDRRELVEDVKAVARAADKLYPDALQAARQGLQEQPRAAPVASVPAQPQFPQGGMPPGMQQPPGMMPPGMPPGMGGPNVASGPPPQAAVTLPPPTPPKQGATVGNPFLQGTPPPPKNP
jgi:hypothetical protein